ncbi:hypothetical protein [Amycolatopsis sp. MEPSY49]|uniref:hypothetical protein n=1 Tax=Amycolatopsis sp. MEPSY49 TaxID=3151600 RepID=UPI003EF4C62E
MGISELSPQTGQITQSQSADGWTHALAAPTPGVPGDSGSAFLDPAGNALGILSTLGLSLLVLGTEPFTPGR